MSKLQSTQMRLNFITKEKKNKSAGAVKQTAVKFKACLGCNQ